VSVGYRVRLPRAALRFAGDEHLDTGGGLTAGDRIVLGVTDDEQFVAVLQSGGHLVTRYGPVHRRKQDRHGRSIAHGFPAGTFSRYLNPAFVDVQRPGLRRDPTHHPGQDPQFDGLPDEEADAQ